MTAEVGRGGRSSRRLGRANTIGETARWAVLGDVPPERLYRRVQSVTVERHAGTATGSAFLSRASNSKEETIMKIFAGLLLALAALATISVEGRAQEVGFAPTADLEGDGKRQEFWNNYLQLHVRPIRQLGVPMHPCWLGFD